MDCSTVAAKSSRPFYGWFVVIAGFAVTFIGFGCRVRREPQLRGADPGQHRGQRGGGGADGVGGLGCAQRRLTAASVRLLLVRPYAAAKTARFTACGNARMSLRVAVASSAFGLLATTPN
ncbi:MAG TPA: hypothetical protein VLX44_00260 [Xanthobacteraceae bacterium]|nr:hypothetical protein [Xanthobacteraceae bacterium]